MKFTQKTYGQPIEILKYNDFKGAPCMVSASSSVDINGRRIVKAGTPWPENDSTCRGLILHDVDVTEEEAPATYIFEGSINNEKLHENNITISTAAKAVLPRITFFD